jgi:hypothetical protein
MPYKICFIINVSSSLCAHDEKKLVISFLSTFMEYLKF